MIRNQLADKRILLAINQPAPYRIGLYQRLARSAQVLFAFDTLAEANRRWKIQPGKFGFDFVLSHSRPRINQRFRRDLGFEDPRDLHVGLGLLATLIRFGPHVVISAEFGIRTIQAAIYCVVFRKPLIIWWEGTPHTEGWVGTWRRLLRKSLVKAATRFWTNGEDSNTLLIRYGAARSQCDSQLLGANTRALANAVKTSMKSRGKVRQANGIDGFCLLFVGQYSKRKGIQQYLSALVRLYREIDNGWSAVFAGDGPLKESICATKKEHLGIPIIDVGFVQPDKIGSLYGAADGFVLPTLDDNWSVVSLEAAISGLPQLFSVYNGATRDLVMQGDGNVVIDPLDEATFYDALKRFVESRPGRLAASRSSELETYYSVDSLLERVLASISLAL